MTNDEAIYVLKNTAWLGSAELVGDVTEAVKMAVEALKRETSDDAISRQAVIDICNHVIDLWEGQLGEGALVAIKNAINNLPSVQPERTEERTETHACDCISRQAVRFIETNSDSYPEEWNDDYEKGFTDALNKVIALPSVQPERTCVNCGRTVNNGGWYADGGTRCPIEEHYALPKDGFCHLWEKRNITDDDYPERREE